ncbi:DegV family protein [Helicovermis profundi]|uniref:DegV family protein n=1 Tax=Helicovermis profundi TaxID=3065157 RepID=A0AAU9EF90_9FIRM|nr:DegV family protein [Clostridia bacterium S502]
MTIKIITDSTSYIPNEIKEKYGIGIVSLSVTFGDEVFKEDEITNEEFYKKLDLYKKIPKSSQPSIDEIYDSFEKAVIEGKEVIGVFLSSKMSGTCSTANLVKKMILNKYENANIRIIDSATNCMQLGFSVIEGAKCIIKGSDFNAVINAVQDNLKKSKFIFMPNTLEYLKMGGRIGNAGALIGELLKIKPILTVKNGLTTSLIKVRTMKKATLKLIEIFENDILKYGFGDAIIHHINCYDEAEKLAKLIEEKVNKKIDIVSIGPVIGTHVGPGSIGIAYFTKEEFDEE